MSSQLAGEEELLPLSQLGFCIDYYTTPYPFAESHDKKKAAPNSSGAFVAEAEKASAAPPNLSSSVFLHLHHLKVS